MTKKEKLEAQGYKTYENKDIQVFWKPRICQHVGECARGNYNVFNPQRRPWIDLSQAPASEIADIIDRCPSKALQYELLNPISVVFEEELDRAAAYDRGKLIGMNIRLEQPQDWREVENLTREAFWNVYRPGCQEHFVLNQYRNNPAFIPELDFVMEEGGRLIGHVMFSKAEITLADGTAFPSWTFGPISIHPDYKRKGYGLKLLLFALRKAREMGIGLLQMEGNIEFYKHAGFDLASKLRIHYHGEPAESEVPYFLAQELIPGYWGNREGTYCPPAGYFVADAQPEAFEAYEASFPAKEKHIMPGQLPQFCQSCGMPLTKDEDCGHNADGSINFDYCQYCYQDGMFLQECTMEEMIDHCTQFVDEGMVEMMRGFFPMLKRWRKVGPNHQ